MKIGRLEIGKWTYTYVHDQEFIWFEYHVGLCDCTFVTLLNFVFVWKNKECEENEDPT
jgi:hypothetical protein